MRAYTHALAVQVSNRRQNTNKNIINFNYASYYGCCITETNHIKIYCGGTVCKKLTGCKIMVMILLLQILCMFLKYALDANALTVTEVTVNIRDGQIA